MKRDQETQDLLHKSYMSGVHNGEMAIKARRCIGCKWLDTEDPVDTQKCSQLSIKYIHTMPNFSCSLWEPKCNQ